MTDVKTEINLRNVRISYPHLFEPFAYQGQGKAKYSAKFLIPKSDKEQVQKIVETIKALAAATYKDKRVPPSEKLCLRDGDTTGRAEDEGYWVLSASDDRRPVVVNRDKSPLVAEDEVIYPGCWVNAKVNLWAQDNQYGKRVNANLWGVQFVKDGDRLGGGRKSETPDEMFGDVSDFGDDTGAESDPFA